MLRYARLRPGRGFRPWRATLYYTQRLVVGPSSRRTVARLIAAGIRLSHPATGGRVGGLSGEAARILERLRRDGCGEIGRVLSLAALEDVRSYLADCPVMAADGRSFAAESPPADVALGAYRLQDVLCCPHLLAVCNAPELLAIVRGYLGCQPTLSSIGLRWSYPRAIPDGADTQRFHRDPDDWRFLKLLVYLSEVDLGSGPHSYVAGSHRRAGQRRARPYAPEELAQHYGDCSILDFTGPAGTALLVDTYGIHRGTAPRQRPRLAFLAQYSLLPIFALEYQPVRLRPRPAVDPYINRLLIS